MIDWLTSEAGMTAMSLVGGFFMRQKAEREKAINARIAQREASMEAAASRTKDGGTWMRRAILGLVALIFVAVVAAGFFQTPVVHEIVDKKSAVWGFLTKTVTSFVTTEGVFFPPEIRQAFLMLCAFYLGQGVK